MVQFINLENKLLDKEVTETEKKRFLHLIKNSEIWKEHSKTHENAQLNMLGFEEDKNSIQEKVSEDESEEVVHKKKKQVFAGCGCGRTFKADMEKKEVSDYKISDTDSIVNEYNVSEDDNQKYNLGESNRTTYDKNDSNYL
ncbi:MAG: hypothetical protein ABH828_03190 [archaeon]